MYLSPNERHLVNLHKVISLHHPTIFGKRELGRFIESIGFSETVLYQHYPIPLSDRPTVKRTLGALERHRRNNKSRKGEIVALDMSDYEKAIYNALLQGASVQELCKALNIVGHETLLSTIQHKELRAIIKNHARNG